MPKDKDNNILAHTSWNCKYHIVFAPKYRRKVFFDVKVKYKATKKAKVKLTNKDSLVNHFFL